MNPDLRLLQAYPFERLRQLTQDISPHPQREAISLSIGEPQHATPVFIQDTLTAQLSGLQHYPKTAGEPAFRHALVKWLEQRYHLTALGIEHVLPVNGSREALFSIAQAVIDRTRTNPLVVVPNPFYQIYEGATLLAGAQPVLLNLTAETGFSSDWHSIPAETWQHVQLVYVCSPHNPVGRVLTLAEWKILFELADKYDFVICADECYSEIWFDHPPLGALEAAQKLGRHQFKRVLSCTSLSKRSNVPGLRSGFIAGDPDILHAFLQYRTYHGCAMGSPIQHASIAAWSDEVHVERNRQAYREKFKYFTGILGDTLTLTMPNAGFYFWVKTPIDDETFTRELLKQENVAVLPGRYLSRCANTINPGEGFVRMALVCHTDACQEAAHRIRRFVSNLQNDKAI